MCVLVLCKREKYSLSPRLRLAPPLTLAFFLGVPVPFAPPFALPFFGVPVGVPVALLPVLALETLKCEMAPLDLEVARIFTRRSVMARGVGRSKLSAGGVGG